MAQPFVYSIILNTNRRQDTLECLASLRGNIYLHNHVLVLDNSSTDGSVPAIREAFPEVEIITLEENRGYTGNNNVGIKIALKRGADWVFVLNEDTVLAPDCLDLLIEVGKRDSGIGIVGPMVYHHDEPGIIQSAGGVFVKDWESIHLGQNEVDEGQFSSPHTVDWISGCGILVRRAVIEQVGLLDERFFYYWEETDWCVRAAKANWRIVHVPQAKLWHKGVQRDYSPSPNVTYYWARNWLLMLSKNRAPYLAWLFATKTIARTLLSWSLKPKWRKKRNHRNAMWQGVKDYIFQRWGMRIST